MTKKERLEMNELSQKVYGNTSRWQKLLKKPMLGDFFDAVSKRKMKETYWPTVEEIKEEMEFLLAEKEAVKT